MEVVSSPRAVKLAEIRPRDRRPDRQQEDSVSSWRHLPGTQLSGRPIFFSLSELLKPSPWPWSEVRWVGGAPGLYLPYLLLFIQPLTPSLVICTS